MSSLLLRSLLFPIILILSSCGGGNATDDEIEESRKFIPPTPSAPERI